MVVDRKSNFKILKESTQVLLPTRIPWVLLLRHRWAWHDNASTEHFKTLMNLLHAFK